MNTQDTEFLQRLLAMFKTEAREHLDVISTGLTKMGKSDAANQAELVETIYREAHSLKGAASSVNLTDIIVLCQGMEDVFFALKRGRLSLSALTCDLLQQAVDYCYRMVDGEEVSAADKSIVRNLLSRLGEALTKGTESETDEAIPSAEQEQPEQIVRSPPEPREPPGQTPPLSPGSVAPETVRIATAKLDNLLLQAEEMIAIKLATGQRAAELRELKKAFDVWKKKGRRESAARVSADPFVSSFETSLTAMVKNSEYEHRAFGAMIDKLLDDMKKTLMLPFSSLLEMFPRMVRDLARTAGKKVELTTAGGEIELDRRVLEEMKDPLIHLVRNCVDHGIETVAERARKRKPPVGNLKITVSSKDNTIEIAVSDDGAGIDVAKIKSSAVRHTIITWDAVDKLGDREGMQLIFHSGVTTSPLITDISGRGLGLAIVREKVEKLNGTVAIESRMDAGTTFTMVVPLTLATFRGTLVRVGERLFVLPSVNVARVARAARDTIHTVENRETLVFDDRPISLVRLADVLNLKTAAARQQQDDGPVQVVLLGLAEKRIAFMVDEVLHEQEVLVRPLGRQLSRVRNISGATVLASGKVAPILNVADLLKSVVKNGSLFAAGLTGQPKERRSVLVVEDSITARALLKNLLESAGYLVQTAVDGLDGITALKSRLFDIVVSDVEMPRMNGFELTARIRSDQKLSDLPVVLVTALESREDRERGIDVGANAYIVKSSFDQSNLLEVIGRLT